MHIKIAVVQLNPTVGDLDGNLSLHKHYYDEAAAAGADIVVFPEMSMTGYPLEDLVLRPSFMDAVRETTIDFLNHVRFRADGPACIFGAPSINNDNLNNSALFVVTERDGGNYARFDKYELPNYGVFDEKRVFKAGDFSRPVYFRGFFIGVMICEDTWFPRVAYELARMDSDLLISINGSPYEDGKRMVRRQVVANRIKETGLPLLYVNAVGGQDELVFDGGSFMYDGETTQEAPEFVEGITYFDHILRKASDRDAPYEGVRITPAPYPITMDNYKLVEGHDIGDTYRALVLGTRDYLRKQGFKSVVLGYSGGVDSGIVAAIAVDALGPSKVSLISLPSKYSSQGSKDDAYEGAKRLQTDFRIIQIEPVVAALRTAYTSQVIPTIIADPQNSSRILTGTADENIQARARGSILMAISNQENKLLLTTGNKSEVSVGYSTLYGDMAGGFNPIKDQYKMMVWALCRWRNSLTPEQVIEYDFLGFGDVEVVPEEIIVKPPSAELRPDQKDSDSLPPYETLDAILHKMVEEELGINEIIAQGYSDKDVRRVRGLLDNAEYKRRQAAPGVKTTNKLHGRERRYPIVNKYRN